MKVTIDIQGSNTSHFLEVLKSIPYISIISTDENNSKEEVLKHIETSFKELKKVKQGKLKTRPAQDLLDEL